MSEGFSDVIKGGGNRAGAFALTEQQARLLGIIRTHIADTGRAPTCEQMKRAMGLVSKSNVHRLLLCLEERGAIRRLRGRARAIEVVDTAPAPTRDSNDFGNAVITEINRFCAAEGFAADSPLFVRLRQRIHTKFCEAQ